MPKVSASKTLPKTAKAKATKLVKAQAISRSKLDLFLECPRCFYLDQKLGVKRPAGPGFSLNSAVDALLKKEFDLHRAKGTVHPYAKQAGLDAVPFNHPDMEIWRNQFKRTGLRVTHEATGFEAFGYPDDIWQDRKTKELIVIEYKATAKNDEVEELDPKWHGSYKLQVAFYQWLLRMKGFKVSPTAWFLFANGSKEPAKFDANLEFRMTMIAHEADCTWIEPSLAKVKKALASEKAPDADKECGFCTYRSKAAGALEN